MIRIGLLILLSATACSSSGTTLIVDLRSDLDVGSEVNLVRAELFPRVSDDTRPIAPRTSDLSLAMDLVEGVRIAEWSGVPTGQWVLLVQALDARGAPVGTRLVAVDVSGSTLGVTVVMTRDCAGVSCPGATAPSARACLGGECVDPRCTPERPEFCPDAECSSDADCSAPSSINCIAGVCSDGVCFDVARDSECETGERCDPSLGCVVDRTDAGPLDAGPADGGLVDSGTDSDVDASVAPPLTGVTMLHSGAHHTCAVRSGDTLCWGQNEFGQLGRGTSSGWESRPGPVVGLAAVDDMGLGFQTSCALDDGMLHCWGDNRRGQAGTGDPDPLYTTPQSIVLANVTDVSSTELWSLAVRSTGQVMVLPDVDAGVTNAVTVAAGGSRHWCVLTTSAQVECVGTNDWGQLGNGTLEPSSVVGLTNVDEVVAGLDFTCARATGRIHCWGRNTSGGVAP